MKKLLAVIIALAAALPASGQDFLQQWKDTATQQMKDFRAAHRPAIEAGGWRFVHGAVTLEGVPVSDYFVKGIADRPGGLRAAQVLNTFYVPIPEADVPEYQSTRGQIWFDCKAGTFEQRDLSRFASADGSGTANSADEPRGDAAPFTGQAPAHQSVEGALLEHVCAAKP